jgi:hypothetical protein
MADVRDDSIGTLDEFLAWVADSFEAHAAMSRSPDETEGYLNSARMARAHLRRLTDRQKQPMEKTP